MHRRRPGSLLPLEIGILTACVGAGEAGLYGFALANAIADTTIAIAAVAVMFFPAPQP